MVTAQSETGHVDGLCGGTKKGGGKCTQKAGWKTSHVGIGRCANHGGATPNHEIAAQKVLATRAVQTYGIKRDLPPAQALLEEFYWSQGHVAWLRDIVAELEPGALVWGVSEEHEKGASEFPGVDVKRLAQPSVWLKLYHDERRMMFDLGKTIETLRLVERQQELSERQGRMLLAMMAAILADPDMGATDAQRALLPVLLERHVAAIAGRSAA